MKHPRVGERKVGGNVAAYFCTPDLRVLAAVGGPVPPDVFLREAQRAVSLAESTSSGFSEDAGSLIQISHEWHMPRVGLWNGSGQAQLGVWRIVKDQPLAPLDRIYQEVFERALGETISDAPVSFKGSGRALWNRLGE